MKKVRALISVSLFAAVFAIGVRSFAAEKDEWLKFFAGEWESEAKISTEEGKWNDPFSVSRECRLLANGHVIVDQRTSETTGETVVVTGWDASKKALVETGYTSAGVTWTATFDSINEDSLSGRVVTTDAEGKNSEGKIRIEKDGPNAFAGEWKITDKAGNMMAGKLTAKRK
jgi:hypothetical protein